MRQLLGGLGTPVSTDTHSPILREVFLQRVARQVRMIFAVAGDMTLDHLATLADRVAESSIPSMSPLSSSPATSDTVLTRIEARLHQLVDLVATLQLHRRPDRPDRDSLHVRPLVLLPVAFLAMLTVAPRLHLLISAGITETWETIPDDALAVARGRETDGPVTDGGG